MEDNLVYRDEKSINLDPSEVDENFRKVVSGINEVEEQVSNIPAGPKGDTGNTGATGATGATGPGVPNGGTAGQVLAKINNTNQNTHWVDPSTGGASKPSGLIPSFRQYGAVGDGVTDDTVAVNQALSENKLVFDNGDFLVTSINNENGCEIQGTARILSESTTGLDAIYQRNSYADKYKHVFGEEYLSSFHKKLISNINDVTPTALKVVISGDSTSFGPTDVDTFRSAQIMDKLTQAAFIKNVTYINNGKGGKTTQQWLDQYLALDLAEDPDVLILRWGINDVDVEADGLLARIEEGLDRIRSNANFKKDKLAIVLCSQSTTTDDDMGHRGNTRNELMDEKLRFLARKYQCCFMDVYAMWQDAYNGQDYMEAYNLAYPNALIHPLPSLYIQIFTKTFEILFPRYYYGSSSPLKDFGYNAPNETVSPTPSSRYPDGISYDYVQVSDGFPVGGLLVTNKNSVGFLSQILTSPDFPASIFVRNAFQGVGGAFARIDAVTQRVSVSTSGITNAKAPNTFPIGISMDFVGTDVGFPIYGLLTTMGNGSGAWRQELTNYDSSVVMHVRVGYNGDWQAWKQVTLT